MPLFRIKAFYMHESEFAAAQDAVQSSVIQDAEWTDSYVMGLAEQTKFEDLTKKGLVISVIEEVAAKPSAEATRRRMQLLAKPPKLTASDSGAARRSGARAGAATVSALRAVPIASRAATPAKKVISQDLRRTQYYIVRLHGPLTNDRQRELKACRVKLLERVSGNKYTTRLKPTEVRCLAELKFVDSIRLYTYDDTLRKSASDAARPEARKMKTARRGAAPRAVSQRSRVYSVCLHRSQDMVTLVRWLKGKKRKPISKAGNFLRIVLTDDSRLLSELSARPEVAVVEPVGTPRLLDDHARTILTIDAIAAGPTDLEGDGEIIAIADTGIDDTHPDFKHRIVGKRALGRPNDTSDPDGHGTHVAGCAAGNGSASKGAVRGAAPRAKLFFQSILDSAGTLGGLPHDLAELFQEAYDQKARIHNNSWGAFTFAQYVETAIQVDRFVADHPDMLIVIAAGNDGISVPRSAGSMMNAQQGFVDYPSVAAPATAKNGLTVGASRNSRTTGGLAQLTWGDAWNMKYPDPPIATQTISGDVQCLAAFSSRGPSGFRIKPDVVAPGTDIAAAKSSKAALRRFWGAYPGNPRYAFMGGTSMAAPYVAGCAALVREWYRKKGNWKTPSAALLKATLINGTRRINGACAVAPPAGDPNFHQGFGRIDMANTLPNPSDAKLQLQFVDNWKTPAQSLNSGDRRRFQLDVAAGHDLRICLAWTDPGANSVQNVLTLIVDDGQGTKWVGNAGIASVLNIAGMPFEPHNNVQLVRLVKPKAAKYTIAVFGTNVLMPPQTFALVATGNLKSALVPI